MFGAPDALYKSFCQALRDPAKVKITVEDAMAKKALKKGKKLKGTKTLFKYDLK